jgi:hybrid cluster-associated redox disulfide protein
MPEHAEMALADLKLAELTMAELMSGRPAVVPVLLRHGLACPGCAMAPFMTVREAAEAYGLELDALLDEIAAVNRPAASFVEIG